MEKRGIFNTSTKVIEDISKFVLTSTKKTLNSLAKIIKDISDLTSTDTANEKIKKEIEATNITPQENKESIQIKSEPTIIKCEQDISVSESESKSKYTSSETDTQPQNVKNNYSKESVDTPFAKQQKIESIDRKKQKIKLKHTLEQKEKRIRKQVKEKKLDIISSKEHKTFKKTSPKTSYNDIFEQRRINKYLENKNLSDDDLLQKEKFFTQCRYCRKKLSKKISYSYLESNGYSYEDADTDHEGNFSPLPALFCSDKCRNEYVKEYKKILRVGNPDTAPYSESYTDQYDWNR